MSNLKTALSPEDIRNSQRRAAADLLGFCRRHDYPLAQAQLSEISDRPNLGDAGAISAAVMECVCAGLPDHQAAKARTELHQAARVYGHAAYALRS